MKPDWKDAPEWANFLCMDADGTWNWFEEKPTMYQAFWDIGNLTRFDRALSKIDWTESLEERPQ